MTLSLADYWPAIGSAWPTIADLQLALQLAALRAGFAVGALQNRLEDGTCVFRCRLGHLGGPKNGAGCSANMVTASQQHYHGGTSWRVTGIAQDTFHKDQHYKHASASARGLSDALENALPATIRLYVGLQIPSSRSFHNIEAAVRAHARRRGRYVSTTYRNLDPPTYTIFCDSGLRNCDFSVQFELVKEGKDGQHRWLCIQVRLRHSCPRTAEKASRILCKRLSFWPKIRTSQGAAEARDRDSVKRKKTPPPRFEKQPGQAERRNRPRSPAPSPTPTDNTKPFPTPAPSDRRSPSPAPSAASTSRSRSASPDRASSRAASPQPAPLDRNAAGEGAEDSDADEASPAAVNDSSIWSSISHRASLLARAESRLPSLRTTVSRLESELEEARKKLQKQEGIVERRKGRMRREMRRALGEERGVGKGSIRCMSARRELMSVDAQVGKGKKEKEGKKRRKGKKRASPEL